MKTQLQLFNSIVFLSVLVRMRWNIGDTRNHSLKLKNWDFIMFYQQNPPRNSPEKITLILLEMQQMPDLAETDWRVELSCLKLTEQCGREVKPWTSRQIQTSGILSYTATETAHTKKRFILEAKIFMNRCSVSWATCDNTRYLNDR